MNTDVSTALREQAKLIDSNAPISYTAAAFIEMADKLDADREQAAADRAALEQLKNAFHETERLRQDAVFALAQAQALLAEVYDDSPCRFDHHGYCQEHGSASDVCIMKRIAAALSGGAR